MSPRSMIRTGVAVIVAGVLLMQLPAAAIDNWLPSSMGLMFGIARLSISLGYAGLAIGTAFLGAGLVLKGLRVQSP